MASSTKSDQVEHIIIGIFRGVTLTINVMNDNLLWGSAKLTKKPISFGRLVSVSRDATFKVVAIASGIAVRARSSFLALISSFFGRVFSTKRTKSSVFSVNISAFFGKVLSTLFSIACFTGNAICAWWLFATAVTQSLRSPIFAVRCNSIKARTTAFKMLLWRTLATAGANPVGPKSFASAFCCHFGLFGISRIFLGRIVGISFVVTWFAALSSWHSKIVATNTNSCFYTLDNARSVLLISAISFFIWCAFHNIPLFMYIIHQNARSVL